MFVTSQAEKSFAHLKFFRLACVDCKRTQDFYTDCLGMELIKSISTGSKTYLYISQRQCRNGLHASFRFEHESTDSTFSDATVNHSADKEDASGDTTGKQERRICESTKLVFYVQEIHEFVQKVAKDGEKYGASVLVQEYALPQTCNAAVLLDPNGYLIELIEMASQSFLKEENDVKVQTNNQDRHNRKIQNREQHIRLAHVMVNSPQANTQAAFYEEFFSSPHSKRKEKVVTEIGAYETITAGKLDKEEEGSTAKPETRIGFQIVDQEHFPEAMASYVWLSNGKRSKFAALLVVTKTARAGTSSAAATNGFEKAGLPEPESLKKAKPVVGLIGLGFVVDDVGTWATRLQRDHTIGFRGEVVDEPGQGRHIRVFDGFGMEIEITEYINRASSGSVPTMQRKFSGRMLVTKTSCAKQRMSKRTCTNGKQRNPSMKK